MTQVLADPVPDPAGPAVALGVPELSDTVIARPRLERQLEAADDSVLRIVEAPTGAGKTLGVARWASGVHAVDGALWLDAGRLDAGRGAGGRALFWRRMRSGLTDLGVGPIATVPAASASVGAWTDWISGLAGALDRDGGRRLLVLDDYPSGPSGTLGRQLTALLARTAGLRVVITCTGTPALDHERLRTAGRSAHIRHDALRLDLDEVGHLLARSGVLADPTTVETVCLRTEGWAFGVDLVARALAKATTATDVLHALDDVLDDVVEAELLDQLPSACRELIVRTSVCAEVPAGLSRAIMGEDMAEPSARVDEARGFLKLKADGAWTCHPLLRRAARRRLDRDWPSLSREARRAAASWNVDHGDRSAGLTLAADLADADWAATALVRSLAVPSVLLGAPDPPTAELAGQVELGTGEPLIVAAAAIAVGEPEAAQAALSQLGELSAGTGLESSARRLTEAIVRMAIARARIDIVDGLHWVRECRRHYSGLTARQRLGAPEIAFLLAAHEAAFCMANGDLARAVSLVEPAGLASPRSEAEAVAVTECVGLLAWLLALRGDLTAAGRHAAEVLRVRAADANEVGVGYAQLAAAWVHLERGELAQAGQRLDHTITVGTRTRDPWLVGAQRLAGARVAISSGEPDVAVRLLADLRRVHPATQPDLSTAHWLVDRCTVALAEAQLAAGDARRALAVLTPEPQQARVEARVLAARARKSIGDRRGARALLASVGDGIADAPLPAVVQLWCLDAELASESGDGERALSLLNRALRAAKREELRTALSPVTPWLSAYVSRHPDLSREHRAFLGSMTAQSSCAPVATRPDVSVAIMLEPLTERELQVLERLAQFLTTDEIAGDLYVSANTVKTHIKSLFLKLSVNRRSDAVRRGRRLGLC